MTHYQPETPKQEPETPNKNKKVLLRERKRHTARRVVSTPSVVLPRYPPPGGGTRTSVPPRGGGTRTWVPSPPRGGGVPGPRYPPWGGVREPPPAASWHSGKCCKALWDMGTPPPCGQTNTCENSTFPSYYVRGR